MQNNNLSDEILAGQRLMIGFDGTTLSEKLKYYIETLKIGGVILFSRNIENSNQVKDLCDSIQTYADKCNLPQMIIAIDQEGGQVARLKAPFTEFDGNPKMKSKKDAIDFAQITAKELKDIGVNMNYAPVLDVAPKDINSIMEKRSFGDDPNWVSDLGMAVINTMQKNNIMAVAKHFPGIGRTVLDSHHDLPILDSTIEELEYCDLIPFKEAILNKVSGIMLSHIFYKSLDPKWPASMSEEIAYNLLRKVLKYDGVVMTDDIDMGAIEKHYDFSDVIYQFLKAEIDLILICHESEKIENSHKLILNSLNESTTLKEKGLKSINRILKLKNQYKKPKK